MARFADGANLRGIVRESVKNCREILGPGDNTIHRSHHHMWLSDLLSVWRVGRRWGMLGDRLRYCLGICFWPLLEVTV